MPWLRSIKQRQATENRNRREQNAVDFDYTDFFAWLYGVCACDGFHEQRRSFGRRTNIGRSGGNKRLRLSVNVHKIGGWMREMFANIHPAKSKWICEKVNAVAVIHLKNI